MCVFVRVEPQDRRDRKFPGTEHSAVCNIPASHSSIEGNLRLITGRLGQLGGGGVFLKWNKSKMSKRVEKSITANVNTPTLKYLQIESLTIHFI